MITIQEAINTIIASIVPQPYADTVDTIKVGDASEPLTGILITFLASYDIIAQAKHLNANLVISHEPIFYGHLDNTDWLQNNPVYQAKRQLIEDNHVVMWRFHDYLHSMKPDPVGVGIIRDLGWLSYQHGPDLVCDIPAVSLRDLVEHVKAKLNIQTLRIVGDLDLTCRRVALMPGFPPAQWQIGPLSQDGVDVMICGEIHEWETSEFVRDALSLKQNKALIVTGHAASEESGMREVIPHLQSLLPAIPIHFVPSRNPFTYV